jgi:hypothetical protein
MGEGLLLKPLRPSESIGHFLLWVAAPDKSAGNKFGWL